MTIRDSVVVITGASSGIGRATALALSRRKARVVLAARREQALEDAAASCREAGAPDAIAVPTDVTSPAAVESLAEGTVERFGGIDVWINDAGVYAVGRFEDIPPDAFRRAIEVDFFGAVHGTRAALPPMRARGRGVIVNVASMLGAVGGAYLTAYAAAKWAVRGFTQSLQQELVDEPGLHACAVLPASIDTPLFQHAANYSGRELKALPPLYDARDVAETVVDLVEHPRPEAIVGAAAKATIAQQRVAPRLTERLLRTQIERTHFARGGEVPTNGNLFEPVQEGTDVDGGWRASGRFGRITASGGGPARLRGAQEHPVQST